MAAPSTVEFSDVTSATGNIIDICVLIGADFLTAFRLRLFELTVGIVITYNLRNFEYNEC